MNILMLTSVYPSKNDGNENVTKVVRYFVHDWQKQGHNVYVVHNAHRYPMIAHRLPKKLKKKISSKISFYIPDWDAVREDRYDDEGVKVWRYPMFKLIPHGGHSAGTIKKHALKIADTLKADGFEPDIIMGHWMSPQAQLISELKQIYNCRTSLVLHGRGYLEDKKFDCQRYLKYVDALGCRSKAEADYIKSVLGESVEPFVCYSGVPDAFVSGFSFDEEKFRSKPEKWRFVYAGRLVEYKQIDKVLRALGSFSDVDFVFDVIGEGGEMDNLKRLAAELGIADKVVFHGRMPRTEVLEYMKKAHCFVMISKGEVFGLVYLEAMAMSCIAIGSLNEGIDGVIKDGENGFLTTAGDADGLTKTLEKLFSMDIADAAGVAKNGFVTASEFTDSNVAKWYLKDAYGAEPFN